MKYVLTFATLMMATACLDSEKEEDTSEEEENEETAFSPSEGSWEVSSPEFEGDCEFGDDDDGDTGEGEEEEEPGEVVVSVDGDALSIVVIEDGVEEFSFSCTLSGQDFSCDPTSMEEPLDGGDMTLVQEMSLSGSFSSSTAFSADISMNMSCTGEDCASLADWGVILPCSMSGSIEGTFVE